MQAEAKAAEASAQAQDYYHKLQNSWTPHWLQQKWGQGGAWASRTLLSDKTGKQNSLGQYVTLARVKLLAFWNAATVGEHTHLFYRSSARSLCECDYSWCCRLVIVAVIALHHMGLHNVVA